MVARPFAAPTDLASFRARAIAAATLDANAFGVVEIACLPHGLELGFVSIAGRSPGYAPRPPVSGKVVVPWAQVRRAHPDGAALRLEVDRAATPFNRLTLVHLTTGARSQRDPFEARRQIRKTAWTIAPIAWIPAVEIVRECVPGLGFGSLVAVALGTFAAIVAGGSAIARNVAVGGADGVDLRDALVAHLAAYGVATRPGAALAAPLEAPLDERSPPFLETLRGMRATALGVAAFAVVALATLGLGRSLLEAQDARDARREAAAEPPAAAVAPPPTASQLAAPPPVAPSEAPELCGCPRADSPLWASGIPRLSLTVAPHGRSARAGHVDLDVVAVNNGATALRDVEVAVQLFRRSRTEEARLEPHGTRGLFWAGDLGPGEAGKWRVRARADAIAPSTAVPGFLGQDDVAPAPADAFAALLGAHTRTARLHGAMMLAYLRDPRAVGAVAKLASVEHDDEALLLDRIARAAAPVFACATHVEADDRALHLRACVANGGAATVSGVRARIVASRVVEPSLSATDGAAGLPGAEWSFVVPDAIPAGEGIVVVHDEPLEAPLDAEHTRFELRVDGAAD